MKLAIMQPYFFPYIGYFQLIAAVDLFILYDNIKYTKKGWVNRNRILRNGKDAVFSLPLRRDSDFSTIVQREIAKDFDRDKLLNQIKEAYRGAPQFANTYPLVEEVIRYEDSNLFRYLHSSIVRICSHFEIDTEIRVSSSIPIDHGLKNEEKVLAICEALGTGTYINAIGGQALYSKETFQTRGFDLKFLRSKAFTYQQFGGEFVPSLSIIDVMMFNAPDAIRDCISNSYELI